MAAVAYCLYDGENFTKVEEGDDRLTSIFALADDGSFTTDFTGVWIDFFEWPIREYAYEKMSPERAALVDIRYGEKAPWPQGRKYTLSEGRKFLFFGNTVRDVDSIKGVELDGWVLTSFGWALKPVETEDGEREWWVGIYETFGINNPIEAELRQVTTNKKEQWTWMKPRHVSRVKTSTGW